MRRVAILLRFLVAGCRCGFALNPALDISQYAHTAWTVRDGFSVGNIFAMAQTPDGYLWLGSGIRLVSLRWRSQYPLATTCGSASPRQSPYSLARHARRHSLDWHVWWPCKPGTAAS